MFNVKLLAFVGGYIALCAGAWFLGNVLSSDAIGMVLGLLFGIFGTLPGMVLVLVAARREQSRRDPYYPPPRYSPPPQPPAALLPGPVTMVFRNGDGRQVQMSFADPAAARRFLAERNLDN